MNNYEISLIESTKEIILSNKNDPNRIKRIKESMNAVYRHFKRTIQNEKDNIEALNTVNSLERMLSKEYLPLNSIPKYDPNEKIICPCIIVKEKWCEPALQNIVQYTRSQLNKEVDIMTHNLEGHCISACEDTKYICERLNIKHEKLACTHKLSKGNFHCFSIVTFNLKGGVQKKYIVDCTYRQFFTYADSFLERIGMLQNYGCGLGTYMLMDPTRKKVAEQILVNGYIELTEETAKHYFDGFVFEGRNGLYYQSLGKNYLTKYDYIPHYTGKDYINALSSEGLANEPYIERQHQPLSKRIIFDIN